MNDKILALCDSDEEYAQHMSEFLKRQKDIPWEIRTYTNPVELAGLMERFPVELLVIAEASYTEEIRGLKQEGIVLLNETGVVRWPDVPNVDKYQRVDIVWKGIWDVYLEIAPTQFPRLVCGGGPKLIGMYSPVRRCLQTSFGLTLGQMLAEKHRTLYLNFEHYAGISELLPDRQTKDLADVLYYLTAEKEKFLLWLRTALQKKGELDYVPPVRAGQSLLTVTREEWLALLDRIGELGDYEYVILDLTESMQGLFDILRLCTVVFTLAREDKMAQCKILQYEQVLSLYRYEDVLEKTRKCMIPVFHRLPEDIEQLTRSDLAEYVRRMTEEVLA